MPTIRVKRIRSIPEKLPPLRQSSSPRMAYGHAKPMTQFSTKCRCVGSMHQPGCAQFSLPDIKTAAKPMNTSSVCISTTDVNVAMKEAMERVTEYENELKTNPQMQELLEKYRRIKNEKHQRFVYENMAKGNWQQVPIAHLLERKRRMRESGRESLND